MTEEVCAGRDRVGRYGDVEEGKDEDKDAGNSAEPVDMLNARR